MSLLLYFFIGGICGYIAGVILTTVRKFDDKNIAYLFVITGTVFAVVMASKSLIVTTLVLVAYTGWMAYTNVKPAKVFIWPTIWLVGAGVYHMVSRIGTGTNSFGKVALFIVIAAVTLLYPFMDRINWLKEEAIGNKTHSDDGAIPISKNRFYLYLCILVGLVVSIIYVWVNKF